MPVTQSHAEGLSAPHAPHRQVGAANGDARLLQAARRGDHDAFRCLIEPRRAELHVHCYRMLGSLHDADDALQEALLRAWRALPRFRGHRLSRPWLFRIATNTCLDHLADRSRRVLSLDQVQAGPAVGEAASLSIVEPYPETFLGVEDSRFSPDARYEEREAVELAFIAALQHLPPRQRAALIIREVLGYSAREVADSLDTSVPAVNSALQRARKTLAERTPERSQQATLRSLGDERVRALVRRFADAWNAGDVEAMLATLTEDVAFTMPPDATVRGMEAVEAFLPAATPSSWRLIPAAANAQLAFGAYRWDPEAGCYRAKLLDVVGLRGERIANVVALPIPELFERFDLPAHVDDCPSGLRRPHDHPRLDFWPLAVLGGSLPAPPALGTSVWCGTKPAPFRARH